MASDVSVPPVTVGNNGTDIELLELEFALIAVVFVPFTVNVYEVPCVKPDTVIGDAPVPVIFPGEDVAVNVVTTPPVVAAVYVTVAADAPESVAVPIVGASGTSGMAVAPARSPS